jgi:hypothetical protein
VTRVSGANALAGTVVVIQETSGNVKLDERACGARPIKAAPATVTKKPATLPTISGTRRPSDLTSTVNRQRRREKSVLHPRKKFKRPICLIKRVTEKPAIRLLAKKARPVPVRRGRPRRYGPDVTHVLVRLWEVGDRMCGELLAAVLPDLLAALERHGDLRVSPQVRELFLTISPTTIDRLLRRHRPGKVRHPKRRSSATATLRSQIPVRTWGD